MTFVIPQNSTDADEKTLDFFVFNDDYTPKTSGVTGENMRLRFGNSALETSDNTIAALDAASGWYKLTLSDTEAATAPCPASAILTSADIADILPVRVPIEIGGSDSLTAGDDAAAIATAVNDDAIARLDSYDSDATTLTIDGVPYIITRNAKGYIETITAV